MVNVLLYRILDKEVIGISPRDIIEKLFPNIPRQKKSEPQITAEEIAWEVNRQRSASDRDPNQVIYFEDVMRSLRAKQERRYDN